MCHMLWVRHAWKILYVHYLNSVTTKSLTAQIYGKLTLLQLFTIVFLLLLSLHSSCVLKVKSIQTIAFFKRILLIVTSDEIRMSVCLSGEEFETDDPISTRFSQSFYWYTHIYIYILRKNGKRYMDRLILTWAESDRAAFYI